MSHYRAITVVTLYTALAACADHPAGPPIQPEPTPTPVPLGVYEITLSGLDGSESGALRAGRAVAVPAGPALALNPVASGLSLEEVSTSSVLDGTRGEGGQRLISVVFRVRNTTGGPLTNLTMIPATTASTIPGTPFTEVQLRNEAPADPAIAQSMVPAGAVSMGEDARLRSNYPDVLQVFTEAEVAAITPPAGVTGLFPYGFVVSNPGSPGSRTLPNAANPHDWGGMVTFAFRYPLQPAGAASDPFTVTFQVVVVEDTETRMTESIEERQDTSGVRRARERAAALGATTVTVLAGSPAADPFVTDYPGQRQICSVRTAGAAGSPTRFITAPASFTELAIYRPGEALDPCAPYYTAGTVTPAHYGMPYQVAMRAMDRYGNVLTGTVDTLVLSSTDGTAVMPAAAHFVNGLRLRNLVYTTYGNSTLTATGRRLKGTAPIFVNGMMRMWDGDIDTNWFTNGDWVQNYHPGVQDSVTIPGDRPFYPLLIQNTTTAGILMTPGTTTEPFINLSSFDLTVAGDVALGTTGTFTGTGRLILTGPSNTVGGGVSNFDVRNLRITDTGRYSASSNLNVTGGRIVVQGGRLRNQGFRIRVRPT
ncbi:MAG TPA: hypothetical protein VEQ60_03550 [Longimicrobium sp.]|nr:hypothetical protein [Longimicrobium sp.]